MSLAQRAVRGTVFILFSSYTNIALGVAYGILMARWLTPETFGIYAGAMFFATLVDVRGKLGLDYALIYKQPATDALFVTHWALQAGAALLTLFLTACAAIGVRYFNYPVATPALMLGIASGLLLEGLGATARAALEKELSFGRSSLIVTSALLLSYVVALGLAWQGFHVWALLGQTVINALAGTLGFWWIYRRLRAQPWRWHFDPAIARWLVRFGATMAIASIATAVLLQFDNFLVLTFVGSAAAGYYVQAYKVAQWPTGLVTHIVSRVSLPTYAKLQNDVPRLSKAFELSLWLILLVALPFALAIFVTAPDFLRLLYGDVWMPAALPLRFLIGYSVLRPLLDDTGALFAAIGQPGRITRVLVAQAFVLIAVATPLTRVYGLLGTAIGVGVSFILGIALTYFYVSKTLTLNLAQLFWPPAVAAGLALAGYALCAPFFNTLHMPLFVRVILKGGAVAAFFALSFTTLQYRDLRARWQLIWRLARPAT
jgi:PST family polysaccharide transporter